MIARVQIVASETIQVVRRTSSDFYAVGTGTPGGPAAVPDDPALPGLALLHRPEHFFPALTPLLRSRLGSHIELTHNCLFVHRHGVMPCRPGNQARKSAQSF